MARTPPRARLAVLVMHGRADTLIGFHHGEKNFAAANPPKLFWELTGDHNDLPLDPRQLIPGVEKLLGQG